MSAAVASSTAFVSGGGGDQLVLPLKPLSMGLNFPFPLNPY